MHFNQLDVFVSMCFKSIDLSNKNEFEFFHFMKESKEVGAYSLSNDQTRPSLYYYFNYINSGLIA